MDENTKNRQITGIHSIARAFDMTLTQLAEFTGYTRQTFYLDKMKLTKRTQWMIHRLDDLSEEMYMDDLKKANVRYIDRNNAIQEFQKEIEKRTATKWLQ